MNELTIIFTILFLIPAIIVILSLIVASAKKSVRNQLYEFVKDNSQALKNLRELNKSFSFYDVFLPSETHTYDNEIFYDSISCRDYLIYQLQFKQKEVFEQCRRVSYNRKQYPIYKQKISEIDCFGSFGTIPDKWNKVTLESIEQEIFDHEIKRPTVDYTISVALYCSQINGRIITSKRETFEYDTIKRLINRINDRSGYFYNDKDIWDAICRVERGKVSNKMRFSIYERDGYRCRKCGRSGRYHDLEIDHIKPIAKGGKSVYSNLQTHCKRCNQEKGDTYYGN